MCENEFILEDRQGNVPGADDVVSSIFKFFALIFLVSLLTSRIISHVDGKYVYKGFI